MRNSILIENNPFKFFCVENLEGLKIFTETIDPSKGGSGAFLNQRKLFVKTIRGKKVRMLIWVTKNNAKNVVAEEFMVFYVKLICVELVGL